MWWAPRDAYKMAMIVFSGPDRRQLTYDKTGCFWISWFPSPDSLRWISSTSARPSLLCPIWLLLFLCFRLFCHLLSKLRLANDSWNFLRNWLHSFCRHSMGSIVLGSSSMSKLQKPSLTYVGLWCSHLLVRAWVLKGVCHTDYLKRSQHLLRRMPQCSLMSIFEAFFQQVSKDRQDWWVPQTDCDFGCLVSGKFFSLML